MSRPSNARSNPTPAGIKRRATTRTMLGSQGVRLLASALLVGAPLFAVGLWGYSAIEQRLREDAREHLEATLSAAVVGIDQWLVDAGRGARVAAESPGIKQVAGCLPRTDEDPDCAPARLEAALGATLRAAGLAGLYVVDAAGRSAGRDGPAPAALVERVQPLARDWPASPPGGEAGGTRFLAPFRVAPERAMTAILAPVQVPEVRAVVVLELRLDAFSRGVQAARPGRTGETYAFDREGRLLTESRFVDQLRLAGLLAGSAERSALEVEIRDPGGDLTEGHRTGVLRREQPLTRMAQAAIQGESGADVVGYRDYRGRMVVGAWRWLSAYDIGVATEVDFDQAFATLAVVRRVYLGVVALLALVGAGFGVALAIGSWSRARARLAERRATRLGQYHVVRKLGQGGMGVVYLATHAMLRRPTAVKVLRPDRATPEGLARFEREVQRTSTLIHPNTVAIYDYGHTDDGTFYYAMEYLDGVDLERLVDRVGPLPEARVVHILRQVAGSLAEAHSAGIVHRDVKPSNLLLCRRGGVDDVVKVLDFGVAKSSSDTSLTTASVVLGTPEYMSPEMFDHADRVGPAADLYSLGAVGYFLLTGRPVFDATTLAALCTAHLTERPVPPSERLGRAVDPTLEMAILGCLAKDKSARPRSAADLIRALDRSPLAHAWTADEAAAWWSTHASTVASLQPQDSVADAEAVRSSDAATE